MGRQSARWIGSLAIAASLAIGCEGELGVRDDRPRISLDDAGAIEPGRDAGAIEPGRDAGAIEPGRDAGSPPPPIDGGSSARDAGPPPDPCGGIDARGVCDGAIARWCEAGALREQDCAATGQVCGDVATGRRCTAPPPPGCGTDVEREELRLTNEARAAAGLGPLVCDEGLTLAARKHSQDMCDQGYFSHTSLDGRTFRDRIEDEGVRWSRIGENIARGQRTPADVHAAWMGSTGHRANILNGAFGRIGIGYVECPGTGPYWTQDFAD